MSVSQWPQFIQDHYLIEDWHHGTAILAADKPAEFKDICDILTAFRLNHSHIIKPGGNKSPIASALDSEFYRRGWVEKQFDTDVVVDGNKKPVPTHKVDCYRNNVAFEVEWNNKNPFFDRDLNNFRLLFDLRTVSVGVIITRDSKLKGLFKSLGRADALGESTTHWTKLTPLIHGGGAGGCPVVAFGITEKLYDPSA